MTIPEVAISSIDLSRKEATFTIKRKKRRRLVSTQARGNENSGISEGHICDLFVVVGVQRSPHFSHPRERAKVLCILPAYFLSATYRPSFPKSTNMINIELGNEAACII